MTKQLMDHLVSESTVKLNAFLAAKEAVEKANSSNMERARRAFERCYEELVSTLDAVQPVKGRDGYALYEIPKEIGHLRGYANSVYERVRVFAGFAAAAS